VKCKDHDICESCYAEFVSGHLPHLNKLNPSVSSRDVSSHSFEQFVDGKNFKSLPGAKKSEPIIKKIKVKPNDPCSCGSNKKYKKCCGSGSAQ